MGLFLVGVALAQQLNSRLQAAAEASGKSATQHAAERDLDLVARFIDGERAAFEELVRHYQRPVYYLAFRYLKNDADAADVCQRAFVRAFQALHRFRKDSSFRTWLFRIAINLSLNHIRDNKRERASDISDDALTVGATGAKHLIHGQEQKALREAVALLPPKQRMVLELRIYDELSFREVGELADCSENAAKVNFHHAVRRLRDLLSGGEQ